MEKKKITGALAAVWLDAISALLFLGKSNAKALAVDWLDAYFQCAKLFLPSHFSCCVKTVCGSYKLPSSWLLNRLTHWPCHWLRRRCHSCGKTLWKLNWSSIEVNVSVVVIHVYACMNGIYFKCYYEISPFLFGRALYVTINLWF